MTKARWNALVLRALRHMFKHNPEADDLIERCIDNKDHEGLEWVLNHLTTV